MMPTNAKSVVCIQCISSVRPEVKWTTHHPTQVISFLGQYLCVYDLTFHFSDEKQLHITEEKAAMCSLSNISYHKALTQ